MLTDVKRTYATNDRLRSSVLQMLEQFRTREAKKSKRKTVVFDMFMS